MLALRVLKRQAKDLCNIAAPLWAEGHSRRKLNPAYWSTDFIPRGPADQSRADSRFALRLLCRALQRQEPCRDARLIRSHAFFWNILVLQVQIFCPHNIQRSCRREAAPAVLRDTKGNKVWIFRAIVRCLLYSLAPVKASNNATLRNSDSILSHNRLCKFVRFTAARLQNNDILEMKLWWVFLARQMRSGSKASQLGLTSSQNWKACLDLGRPTQGDDMHAFPQFAHKDKWHPLACEIEWCAHCTAKQAWFYDLDYCGPLDSLTLLDSSKTQKYRGITAIAIAADQVVPCSLPRLRRCLQEWSQFHIVLSLLSMSTASNPNQQLLVAIIYFFASSPAIASAASCTYCQLKIVSSGIGEIAWRHGLDCKLSL